MKRMNVLCLIISPLLLITTLSGCFPKLVTIYISPSSADLTVGETKDFAVHGTFSDGSNQPIHNAKWHYSGDGGSISTSYGAITTFIADEEGVGKLWVYDSLGELGDSVAISVDDPSTGEAQLTNNADIHVPDLGTITDKLHFDAVSSIPSDAIITEAYFECKIYHTFMKDLHIDLAHNSTIWTEFNPDTNISPQIFACYIPEWIGMTAKFDAVLWVKDEAGIDVGYVDYWTVRIKWARP